MNRTTKRPVGWHNGEYYCPCGTIFGKNLRDESPTALVAQHAEECSECHAERHKQTHQFDIRTATHLPNGAQILSRHSRLSREWTVLCSWKHRKESVEYVTWVVDPNSGEAYWGHYFAGDYSKAEKDFDDRNREQR